MGNSQQFALERKAKREAGLALAQQSSPRVRRTVTLLGADAVLSADLPSETQVMDLQKTLQARGPEYIASIAPWIFKPCPAWYTTSAPNDAFKRGTANNRRAADDKRDINGWSKAQIDALTRILNDDHTWRDIDGHMYRWIFHPVNAAYLAELAMLGNAADLLDCAAEFIRSAKPTTRKGLTSTDTIEYGALSDVDPKAKELVKLAAACGRAYDALDRASLKAATTYAAADITRRDARQTDYITAVATFAAAWQQYHGSMPELSPEVAAEVAPVVQTAVENQPDSSVAAEVASVKSVKGGAKVK